MRKVALLTTACFLGLTLLDSNAYAEDSGFEMQKSSDEVTFVKGDGSAKASLRIMMPVNTLSTTKNYAQYVMDRYSGWGLNPVLDLRGFSFQYVDNAPCAGLLTYFDGRSFLLFTSCGKIEGKTLQELYSKADKELRISEKLKREGRASFY